MAAPPDPIPPPCALALTRPACASQGKLMAPPNVTWHSIIQQATVSPDVLKQPEVVRNVQNILQTNVSVASSLGPPFLAQMRIIYEHMLTVYKCAPLSPAHEGPKPYAISPKPKSRHLRIELSPNP